MHGRGESTKWQPISNLNLNDVTESSYPQKSLLDPDQPHPTNRGRSFATFCLDTWYWEILSVIFSLLFTVAIVATLGYYNGRSEPSLPKGVTLNAMVSVLATGTKSYLIFVTSQSIGQLKWIWFRRRHRLIDLQTFDNASRGPLGSFIILYEHRACTLASLGAFITILAVTFDPFMQQLLSYPKRQIASPLHTASVKQVYGDAINSKWVDGTALQGVNAGIWTDNFDFAPSCPSGNCTWPLIQSLGYCQRCTDATSTARLENCRATPMNLTEAGRQPTECNITFPGPFLPQPIWITTEAFDDTTMDDLDDNIWLNVPEDVIFMKSSSRPFSYLGFDPLGVFSHAKIGPPDVYETPQLGSKVKNLEVKNLTECAITLCLQTYNISVHDGKSSVQTLSEEFGSWEKRSYNETIWRPDSYNSTNLTSSGSSFEYKGRGWIMNLGFMNGTNTVRWFFQEKNSTWRPEDVKFGDPPSDAIQHIIETGLEPVTRNLAASMTKLARNESNKTVPTTVFVSEAYVSVAWIWLAAPALVLALSILFLALTILLSLREDCHDRGVLWKTSALPILYHGLEEEDSRESCVDCTHKNKKKTGESLLKLSEMEIAAGETSVRLEDSQSRGKLMLR